jgi:DNA polymerase-3 subunit delta'
METATLDGAIAPAGNTVLFGHDQAQAFLAQSYASGKGHHAILIEGPEGIGKATLAFRFANHVLSHPEFSSAPHQIEDPDPASPVFRQIAGGASHNLLYLTRPADPKTGKLKSGITVDEVRRAGKFFAQTSGTGNWRIVIVDTADDLNRNAANAILKMLEEPPKRAMFLVLSHAPGKLLPTIRSRCLPLILRPLSDDDLAAALGHLGISVPQAAAARILALSGGSVAQAIKLINYGGLDVIDAFDAAMTQTGPVQRKAMHKLADAVAQKDGDTLYGFFIDHVGQFVSARARAAAMAGDVNTAYGLSRLNSAIVERFSVADAYNLERKQTVLTVLGELAAQI